MFVLLVGVIAGAYLATKVSEVKTIVDKSEEKIKDLFGKVKNKIDEN